MTLFSLVVWAIFGAIDVAYGFLWTDPTTFPLVVAFIGGIMFFLHGVVVVSILGIIGYEIVRRVNEK
jgi:hypothetical protein